MSEQQFDETFVRRELEERFRKVFGRDMNTVERQAFFLPCDSSEETVGLRSIPIRQLGKSNRGATIAGSEGVIRVSCKIRFT